MSISDEQLALNQGLHKSDPSFGSRVQAAGIAAYLPLALFRMHGTGMCSSVLDYGTGKGMLVDRLRAQLPDTIYRGFDPAVPKWSNKPNSPADIVLCLDVLEHVERKSIDDVMSEIQIPRLFCLVVVDLRPAVKPSDSKTLIFFLNLLTGGCHASTSILNVKPVLSYLTNVAKFKRS